MAVKIKKNIDKILLRLPRPVTIHEATVAVAGAGIKRSSAGVRKRLGVLGIEIVPPTSALVQMLRRLPHPIEVPATVALLAKKNMDYTQAGVRTACHRHGIPVKKASIGRHRLP